MQNTAPVQCAGAISVLNHYYGRDGNANGNGDGDGVGVPIGAYNIATPGATLQMQDPLPYVPALVQEYPSSIKNTSSPGVWDAVELYRKVLAEQDCSAEGGKPCVAISSIGIHTNLAALLRSG